MDSFCFLYIGIDPHQRSYGKSIAVKDEQQLDKWVCKACFLLSKGKGIEAKLGGRSPQPRENSVSTASLLGCLNNKSTEDSFVHNSRLGR